MLYERRYSDEYLKRKYIFTSDNWAKMLQSLKKYEPRLRKYSYCFDAVHNPLTGYDGYARSGYEIGEDDVYEYFYIAENKYKTISNVYFMLYSKEIDLRFGRNFFYELYKELKEKQENGVQGALDYLFYDLDYLEYAYPKLLAVVKNNSRKISQLRWESFWSKFGF